MEGRKLKVWIGHDAEDAPVPKPRLHEVLYSHPNPDGSHKHCSNCVLWLSGQQQCFIHDSDVPVVADAICGYHVFGTPGANGLNRENIDPVEPEHSGLMRLRQGESCDTCTYYSARGAQQGVCRAVAGFDSGQTSANVAALGSCTRWADKGG